jgi:hypothetical protein
MVIPPRHAERYDANTKDTERQPTRKPQPATIPGCSVASSSRQWGTLVMQMDDQNHATFEAVPQASEAEAEGAAGAQPEPARRVLGRILSGVAAASEPITERGGHAWSERPGARVRRVRRMAKQPLASLSDVHPEARSARPVEVGLSTIEIDEIDGTAVGGGDQRGGDFLPLKSSRTKNWAGRWQRLRKAQDSMAMLPPIDVFKYGGRYWVVDGHNRVALALYGGQKAVDANIVELVPLGERRTEPIVSLAPSVAASRAVRAAASGKRPSLELSREDATSTAPPDHGGDG